MIRKVNYSHDYSHYPRQTEKIKVFFEFYFFADSENTLINDGIAPGPFFRTRKAKHRKLSVSNKMLKQ